MTWLFVAVAALLRASEIDFANWLLVADGFGVVLAVGEADVEISEPNVRFADFETLTDIDSEALGLSAAQPVNTRAATMKRADLRIGGEYLPSFGNRSMKSLQRRILTNG